MAAASRPIAALGTADSRRRRLARRLPLVSFGMGWFFLQLLPTSLIPRNDLLSERNLYLPSIGLVAGARRAWLAFHATAHDDLAKTRLVQFCLGKPGTHVSSGALPLHVQRNQLYRDRLLLWSDAVKKSPNKARPHNNLGHAYALARTTGTGPSKNFAWPPDWIPITFSHSKISVTPIFIELDGGSHHGASVSIARLLQHRLAIAQEPVACSH